MKLIDIGYGNLLNAERMIAVTSPDSLPVRRLVQDAKGEGRVVDATCGKKTRAVIIMDSDHVVCSAEEPAVIAERVNGNG